MQSIMYNNKEIHITRDIFYQCIGAMLLACALILTELFNFVEMAFDFGLIKTADFWATYFFKLGLSYLAYFGIYMIAREQYLKSPKIIIQREQLRDEKSKIIKGRNIESFERWLDDIYNFSKAIKKWRIIAERKYIRANKHNNIELKEKIKLEFEHINKFEELLKARKSKDEECVNKLKSELSLDELSRYSPKINYNKLFNVDYSNCSSDESIDYEEGKTILNKILPTIFGGMFMTGMLGSLLPPLFLGVTIEAIVKTVASLLTLCWYMFNGVQMANIIVFGRIYFADTTRINICDKYKEDNGIN